MVPSINVNLKPCTCPDFGPRGPGFVPCDSPQILLPCPTQRSVTFSVALGPCTMMCANPALWGGHSTTCPARPVRVSCSVSGETWEESEVEAMDAAGPTAYNQKEWGTLYAVCRARWALVKALVLGQPQAQAGGKWLDAPTDLFTRRDAVFDALADMARAERACVTAWLALPVELRSGPGPMALTPEAFERYVERLIEQVSVIS